jgi:tetratricopeptide (TPR) repeat protein
VRITLVTRQDDIQTAQNHFQKSLSLGDQLSDLSIKIATLNNLSLLFKDTAEYARAQELAQEALELCTKQGDRHRQAALLNNLADLVHIQGEQEIAMDYLKQSSGYLR